MPTCSKFIHKVNIMTINGLSLSERERQKPYLFEYPLTNKHQPCDLIDLFGMRKTKIYSNKNWLLLTESGKKQG